MEYARGFLYGKKYVKKYREKHENDMRNNMTERFRCVCGANIYLENYMTNEKYLKN